MTRVKDFKCLYKVLGVNNTASRQEIRLAYGRLAKIYHPDAGASANPVLFSQISDAYRVLSDAKLKQKYDLKRAFMVGDEDIDLSDVGIGVKKEPLAHDQWNVEQWQTFLRERENESHKENDATDSKAASFLALLGLFGLTAAGVVLWKKIVEAREAQQNLVNHYKTEYGKQQQEIADLEKNQSLVPSRFKKFKIIEREQLTPDTFRIRIALDSAEAISGLSITSCILIKDWVGTQQTLTRAYTPVSEPGQRGHMDIVIKVAGRLSKILSKKKVGDHIEIKGPINKFYYGGPNTLSSVSMLAGGSGITPHFQLLRVILNDPNDHTPVHMLYASRSTDDIILRNELDELAKKHPDQFSLTYVVDKIGPGDEEESWKKAGHVIGRIDEKLITEHLHAPGDTNGKLFICGPGGMIEDMIGHFTNHDLYNIYHKSSHQGTRSITGKLGYLGFRNGEVYEF
mmetsp:Transcript_2731/g.10494  ORF Transcript_2731/g.10494 Transcript_2731/m.10494 type:complete len:456 (-) Transcript_2731:1854-3221(-)